MSSMSLSSASSPSLLLSSSFSSPIVINYTTLQISTRYLSTSSPISTSTKSRSFKSHSLPIIRCSAQLAELAPAASAAYGTLLLGGGLFAYTRSGSKGSLFGGLSGAVLMGAVYVLLQVPETKYIGDALGFGSAFLFSSVFGIRLAATRKLMPAGLLLGLSVCALAVFISAYLQDRV
ncbi:hypothetical protein AAC387_Pa01g3486 [Persea americana]|eukprot:TRINITY_DN4995_c0_g2_i1.p1 TRINITY_DN4995_c0_g2~~TRINITY_DN4995_c0_g2_i1.p1  ORF type:complete len:177 (+),score=26.38 TRINITY_DN4995_c0_g2_i1:145-675(+)